MADIVHNDTCSSVLVDGNPQGYPCDCYAGRVTAENTRLRAALTAIAEHPHCATERPTGHVADPNFANSIAQRQYEIGAADGHRCAAAIAKSVLGEQVAREVTTCRNFDAWGCNTDETGKYVDPRSCRVCGGTAAQHAARRPR